MPGQYNIEWRYAERDEYLKRIRGFARAQVGWICNSGNPDSRLDDASLKITAYTQKVRGDYA